MTPIEKAKELIDKYLDLDNYNNLNLDLFCDECGMSDDSAKYCALIAVQFAKENPLNTNGYNKFLQEVEEELEKL